MEKRILKGGAEKARLKRAAQLKLVANDPKQRKLFSFQQSNSIDSEVNSNFTF